MYVRTGITALTIEIVQLIRNGPSPLRILSLADQPAAKQMLINFVNGDNTIDNAVHNAWQTTLKNLGYPQGSVGSPLRLVAISNGSECATPQGFSAGANLFTYTGKANTRFLGDFAGIILFPVFPIAGVLLGQPALFLGVIPGRNDLNFDFKINAQADNVSNEVYKGKITFKKTIFWLVPVTVNITNKNYFSNASTLPYDYFPGGYYPIPLNLKSSSDQNVLIKYNITAYIEPSFCFVPTVSALDIGSNNVPLTKADYLMRYVGGAPPSPPKNSPFQNFITAFSGSKFNEEHISITRRNGDWIADELNGLTPAANCSTLCNVSLIAGNSSICTSPTSYTIPNLPVGAVVTWSAVPDVVNFSCNPCAQPTLTKKGNGQMTLTATITNVCGSPLVINKPDIIVGQLKPGPLSWTWDLPPGRVFLQVEEVPGATSYQWYLNSTLKATTGPSVYRMPINGNVSCGNYYYFSVKAVSSCGTSDESYVYAEMPPCDFAYKVSPNPATENIKIETINQYDKSGNKNASGIHTIEIYDKMGVMKMRKNLATLQTLANISVASLKNDVYTLRIFDGQSWQSCKIVILH